MGQATQPSTEMSVESRLTELELQVAALKQQVARSSNRGWLERTIGSTKDMPDFEDVVRYGREARQAQAPHDDGPA